jgi:predicted TPR repeat methyltransferase
MSLNLYAKVEHLLEIEDATEQLHQIYIQMIKNHNVTKLLDIGCGRGTLISKLPELTCKGIDLSSLMVQEAQKKGLDAECVDICEVSGSYDMALAVFDVLNFMDTEALDRFMRCVALVLEDDGIFIADINTLHGFSGVAEGVMVAQDDELFLSVDAIFEDNVLNTEFTLFNRQKDDIYTKEQETITQYFHPLSYFKKNRYLKLIEKRYLSLYDNNDKMLLVFKKVTT